MVPMQWRITTTTSSSLASHQINEMITHKYATYVVWFGLRVGSGVIVCLAFGVSVCCLLTLIKSARTVVGLCVYVCVSTAARIALFHSVDF